MLENKINKKSASLPSRTIMRTRCGNRTKVSMARPQLKFLAFSIYFRFAFALYIAFCVTNISCTSANLLTHKLDMATGGGGSSSAFTLGAPNSLHQVSEQTMQKCASIAFDAKYNLLVEVAGEEGLRFRQSNLPSGTVDGNQSTRVGFSDVFRYLQVPATHIVFTPYNMMLCCHGSFLSMVRHCTGQLVYRTKLDCGNIGGVAFDSASDSFFISDTDKCCVLCMPYMEFHRSRKLEIAYTITPAGLCVFANSIFIGSQLIEDAQPCGVCYRLKDGHTIKISRVALTRKLFTGKYEQLLEALQKQYRPTTLDGLVALPQAGSQQSRATLVGISEKDHAIYAFRVRNRRAANKGSAENCSLTIRLHSRDDTSFVDRRSGTVKVPRSITALSNEYIAVYFEVCAKSGNPGNNPESCGLMIFRSRSATA